MGKMRKINKRVFVLLGIDFLIVLCMLGWIKYRSGSGGTIVFEQESLTLNRALEENGNTVYSSEAGNYVDDSYEGENRFIESPSFELGRGIYEISVTYESLYGTGMASANRVENTGWHSLYSDNVPLQSGENELSFRIYSNHAPQKVFVRLAFPNEDRGDYLLVRNITIRPESVSVAACAVITGIVLFLTDICVIMFVRKKKQISGKLCFSLGVVTFIACYPLFTDYLLWGDDLSFQLMRIEGIADGLSAGMFPVKIQPSWCDGNGYAVGVMYGDIFLYLPAVLRLAGVTVQGAYRIYVCLINLLTVIISFLCFTGISGSRKTGLMGCALYTLALYRLTDVYTRAAVGEYTAMSFYPLILYGLYLVYREKDQKKAVAILAIGGTGLIQSHILSCEMACFFIVIVSVLLWKKSIRREVWMTYLKTVSVILLLNLWFIVPFLDYFITMPLAVKDLDEYIQSNGVTLAKLFSFSPLAPNGVDGGSDYRLALTIGPVFLIVLTIFVLNWWRKDKNAGSYREGILCFSLAGISLFMSTVYCPYDWLCRNIGLLGRVVSSIQFPWRFLAFGVLFLSWLACITVKRVAEGEKREKIIVCLCILAALQGLYGGGEMLTQKSGWIYDSTALGSDNLIGGEYLLTGTKPEQVLKVPRVSGQDVSILQYRKNIGNIQLMVNCENENGYVEVPFLYYKGYTAVDQEKRMYSVTAGDNNQVRILLPQGKSELEIAFQEPFYWRAAESISLMGIAAVLWIGKRRFL